jgi:undecaprenyl-diphosphatase
MYLADSSKRGSINIKNHNYSNSFLIGFFQAFAIFPGVSRSGVTISSALISGWERGDAAKFSFLLGIPAISLAAIVEFISSFNEFFLNLNIIAKIFFSQPSIDSKELQLQKLLDRL